MAGTFDPIGGGGGDGTPVNPVTWNTLPGKPGTFAPIIGETATTAKAGDYQPTWQQVTNKPSVIAAGATASEARQAIDAIGNDQKGVSNGVAPLDEAGLVPLEHLNVSGLTFKGAWDPRTNEPTLLNGQGSTGDFYKASHDGQWDFGVSPFDFVEGDWVMFAAGVWQRLGSKETVSSVNGKLGTVVLSAADVAALPETYRPDWNATSGSASIANKPTIPAPTPTDVYRRSNAVGTVSQAAGVPTGAIVGSGVSESGNTHWVRWADGTQMVWAMATASSISSSVIGNLYQSAITNFSFTIAPFVGRPVVTGSAEYVSGVLGWPSVTLASDGVRVEARLLAGGNTARARLGYIAIGRWY